MCASCPPSASSDRQNYNATDPEFSMDLTVADIIIPSTLLQNEK